MLKQLTSIKYSNGAFNTAMLLLRLGGGILLMSHGYPKMAHFSEYSQHMPSLFGIGQPATTVLVIIAEFFCALFVALGLFTRLACIPILFNMGYIAIKIHNWDVFDSAHAASLFFAVFLTLLIVGPGKFSIDGLMKK